MLGAQIWGEVYFLILVVLRDKKKEIDKKRKFKSFIK